MTLAARMLLILLALSLLSATVTAAILLHASFWNDLQTEQKRGLDGYAMFASALKQSLDAYADTAEASLVDRAVRITMRYMTNAPMVAITDAGGALVFDNFTRQNGMLLEQMPGPDTTYKLVESSLGYFQLIRGAIDSAGQLYTVYYGWELSRVYAAARQQANSAALLLLAMGVLALLLGHLALRASLAPLRSLQQAAAQIARGEYAARARVVHPHDEVGRLAQAFNQMSKAVEDHVQALTRQDRAQKQFIADMAHEIKTPMTSMIGYADLMRRSPLSQEDQQRALGAIVSQGERLERMAFKLLSLSRLEGGTQVQFAPHAVADLFALAAQAVETLRQEKQVQIVCLPADGQIVCDLDMMVALLQNLLSNAIKASRPGGLVRLASRGNILSVCDDGIGIPAEHMDKLGEPFYMVDKSRARSQQGAGLGLALCRRIAQAHDAQLVIESRENQGTCVQVVFTTPLQAGDNPDMPPAQDNSINQQ